jgi:hypothetical protein
MFWDDTTYYSTRTNGGAIVKRLKCSNSILISLPQREQVRRLGNASVVLTTDLVDGREGDTTLTIGGQVVCCVAGNQYEEFITKLNMIVEEYRI